MKYKRFQFAFFLICFSINFCFGQRQNLLGIFRNTNSKSKSLQCSEFNEILLLNADSSFHLLCLSNQCCYIHLKESRGKFHLSNDTIHFESKPDTINNRCITTDRQIVNRNFNYRVLKTTSNFLKFKETFPNGKSRILKYKKLSFEKLDSIYVKLYYRIPDNDLTETFVLKSDKTLNYNIITKRYKFNDEIQTTKSIRLTEDEYFNFIAELSTNPLFELTKNPCTYLGSRLKIVLDDCVIESNDNFATNRIIEKLRTNIKLQ